MEPLPHLYSVTAAAAATGIVGLHTEGLPGVLKTAAPVEFGGPGNEWSPESLLAGAIASCFILSFRSVARDSKLEWVCLDCEVEATLERKERVLQFTRVVVRARLIVPAAAETALCERALQKAEHGCLVANSLKCERELRIAVVKMPVAQAQATAA